MEESNVYRLKVREKKVLDGTEYDELNYDVFKGNLSILIGSNEAFLAPPIGAKAQDPIGTALPFPLTYCLIRPAEDLTKCLSVTQLTPGNPLSSHIAVLSPVSSVPFSDEAYKQSWEICWLPSDNACNLRNKHKAFLKISSVSNSTPPTIDVGVGAGLVHEDCFWELVKDSGNPPTTPNKYKIRNIRTLQYLKANTTTNEVDPTLIDTEATIWDFQISGTVPP